MVLAGALAGGMPPATALVAASLGNGLACLVNFGIGWWGRTAVEPRLARSRGGRAALKASTRWGTASLLLSWLPVLGDPLTVVAGAARVHPALFVAVVLPLRVARYVVIAGLV